ncbi:MAG: DUF6677 family protein [Phycisphaerae bacterium]
MSPALRVPLAGLLAWILPGLGHIFIGERVRGTILLVTITLTFWSGVAIGGVRDTVDSETRKAWFVAQTCTGVHGLVAHAWSKQLREVPAEAQLPPAHWLAAETGVVYAGVAGLLNVLIILDALIRADQPSGGGGKPGVVGSRGGT